MWTSIECLNQISLYLEIIVKPLIIFKININIKQMFL